MTPNLGNSIATDLEKTGFPSEFRARSIVRKHGYWDCTATMGYFDKDEQKHRNIDLYAFMPCGDRIAEETVSHTVWHLVIEIKKADRGRPWVVFKERRDVIREVILWKNDFVSYKNLPCEWEESLSWKVYSASFCNGQHWIGYGIHEAFKEPSEISKPYGAMISVIKAAEHVHAQFKPTHSDGRQVVRGKQPVIHFVRPVVVLDGVLTTADLNAEGKIEIEEIEMAPMYVSYRSPNYEQERYRVDLVRLDAFDRYLTSVENQHNSIREALIEHGTLKGAGTEPKLPSLNASHGSPE